ncbi:MAG: ComF family protein [Oscillospiraceae bacterium]|nr:ComF family protein [Oscillospiraceae bacterium]
MSFISSILDLFFPPKCVFCGRVLGKADEGYCDRCTESLPFTEDFGRQSGEHYDFCVAPLYYRGLVRKSMLRYKFKGATNYAEVYAKFMADCIKECPELKYDMISWVPLSSKRSRSRGYDQAMLLALATALYLDDVAVETLVKPHDVQPQSELIDKQQRSANIDGAYKALDPELISGKTILLIDDIITTGSTLDECAKILRENGAARVVCAALARGE